MRKFLKIIFYQQIIFKHWFYARQFIKCYVIFKNEAPILKEYSHWPISEFYIFFVIIIYNNYLTGFPSASSFPFKATYVLVLNLFQLLFTIFFFSINVFHWGSLQICFSGIKITCQWMKVFPSRLNVT